MPIVTVRQPHRRLSLVAGILSVLLPNAGLSEGIFVPNASFELPVALFPSPNIHSWQKTPKPDWYEEDGVSLSWTQLTGVFQNTAPGNSDHIINCDGDQAVWLFALPEVGLFQDYDSIGSGGFTPTHEFNAVYEVGKAYALTVGVIGTGGGMRTNATLELSLYCRDSASNRVTVSALTVTNLPTVFSNNTQFLDFTVTVPPVQPGDPCAGQKIGILFLSTVSYEFRGGYWDLDNVRLTATPVELPTLTQPALANGQFQFTLESAPGLVFELLAATNAALPLAEWSSLGTLTNVTGTIPWVDTNTNFNQRFYRARQVL